MVRIREMQADDWPQVAAVYAEGIATGHATFETTVPAWAAWDAAHRADCRFVAVDDAEIAGWAALSPVSTRCVYGGVAEISVYVAESARGNGIGKALLEKLIEASETVGIWTLQAGLFPENIASQVLHERAGFRMVGRREKIGKLKGVWRDTLLLERRSSVAGQPCDPHCNEQNYAL